jgi:beta-phosphoglucomutase-like phosphatase (HAD superfamily)
MHAILFDIDGTLLESTAVDARLYEEAVRAVLGNIRLRQEWTDYVHVTDSGLLREIMADNGILHTAELEERVRSTFVSLVDSHIEARGPFREVPGARRFVEALVASSTHAVAFATGGWGATAERKLRSAGFDVGAVPLRSSDDAIRRAEIMLAALQALGDGFESITYYGDAPWDERACRELNWRFQPVGQRLGGLTEFTLGGEGLDSRRADPVPATERAR